MNSKSKKLNLALDFWTTNSAIFSVYGNEIKEHLFNDSTTFPSAVFREWLKNNFYYGYEAVSKSESTRGRLLLSLKKMLKYGDVGQTQFGNKTLKFKNIIKSFLEHHIVYIKEEVWAEGLWKVVCWVPVLFMQEKEYSLAKQTMEKILKEIWFKEVEFKAESDGALFSHIVTEDGELKEQQSDKNVLVVDIWWWTTDFTVAQIKKWASWDELATILSTWGIYEWWDSINSLIIKEILLNDYFWKDLDTQYRDMLRNDIFMSLPHRYGMKYSLLKLSNDWRLPGLIKSLSSRLMDNIEIPESTRRWLARIATIANNRELWYHLHRQVEEAKKQLTIHESVEIYMGWFEAFQGTSNDLRVTVSRSEFEEKVVKKSWASMNESLIKTLWLANITPNEIDEVVLVWWTTMIPYIKNQIIDIFWIEKVKSWRVFDGIWYGLAVYLMNKLNNPTTN